MRFILALAALAFAVPAQAADQFDLLCMFGKTELRYRVDLKRQEVCEGECNRIWKMGISTSGELKLIDTITNYPDELPETVTVNRKTGDLVHWVGGTSHPVTETAICRPTDFSGFPATKF